MFAYLPETPEERMLVVLNFSGAEQQLDLSAAGVGGEIACASGLDREGSVELAILALRGDEGLLIRLRG